MTFMPEDYGGLAGALAGYGKQSSPFDKRRTYGYQLLQQGSDTSPVASPWQGAARLAQALAGGLELGMVDREEKAAVAKQREDLAKIMAEPDPQKRIGLLSSVNPDLGMRYAGQFAVEQAKLREMQGDTARRADAYPVPQQAGGMPMQLPGGSPPPGGFNNNAGNIRVTPAAWPGEGAPQNGFKTFATPQDGVNAMVRNYQAYIQQDPNISVAKALMKWAPPNENDSYNYVRTITEGTGINPGMPLAEVLKDPAMAAQFLEAQTRLEKGGVPQGFTPDTFSNATRPQGLQIDMTRPTIVPQPQASTLPPNANGQGADGMPPPVTAGNVRGPAVVAPPTPPQRLSVDQAPPQVLAPFVQRLRTGGYGYGADAEIKMRTEAQAALDRLYDTQKLDYEQKLEASKYERKRTDEQPQQTITNEREARQQFDNLQPIKDARKANSVFRSAIDGSQANTPAGDLNMIYAFATLMDPGSVVREGEMSMVKGTQTVGDLVRSLSSYVEGGSRLSPRARQELLAMMDSRYRSYEKSHDELAGWYGSIADRSGMNRENVIMPLPPINREKPGEQKAGAPGSGGRQVYDMNGKPL